MTEALPLPYRLSTDIGVTIVLFCCFFLSAYVLSRSRKFLLQLGHNFVFHRERASIFATSSGSDMRYLLLLVLQACVLCGVCLYCHSVAVRPELTLHLPPPQLLGICVGVSLLYFLFKWLVYSLLGWIFFDPPRTALWFEAYSTLLYYLGFMLLLFSFFTVYFERGLQVAPFVGMIIIASVKISMLFKWFRLFCNNLRGSLLLILYFCALEVMPCFLMYEGMKRLNVFLIINF